MNRMLPLLLLAACASPKESATPPARWEVDEDLNLAVALCPGCSQPVDRDQSKCAACGCAYRIETKIIACPQCQHGTTKPCCAACDGAGTCSICEGSGTFEGKTCPECEGKKACADCANTPPPHACENCGGTGTLTLR